MTINYSFAPTSLAALLDVEMPSTFSKIHSYILYRLQLPDWKLSKVDVANRFNISMSTVKRAFKWLQDHGYLSHDSIKKWQVYPSPNLSKGVNNEPLIRVNNEPLYIEVSLQRNITTTLTASEAPTASQNIVVVIDELKQDGLIYPPQIKDLKPIKKVLKKIKPEVIAKQPEITQEVLFELAYAMTTKKLSSVPGYLSRMVDAVNDSTFTRTATKNDAGGTISNQANIDKTQQRLNEQRQLKSSPQDVGRAGLAGLKMAMRGLTA